MSGKKFAIMSHHLHFLLISIFTRCNNLPKCDGDNELVCMSLSHSLSSSDNDADNEPRLL